MSKMITGLAEIDPYNPLVVLEGSKIIEEVRESIVGSGSDRRLERTAVVASTTEGGSIKRRPMDVSWLAGASEAYNISADVRDYIFVNVPIVTADFPNRNMDCFTYEELTTFSPVLGRFVYGSFKAKPMHLNHKNKNPLEAKGVHFDATLRKYKVWPGKQGYQSNNTQPRELWKVRVMLGACRQKDPKVAQSILDKKRTGYSMGAWIDHAFCSVCHNDNMRQKCTHRQRGKGSISADGRLVYDCVAGVNFFETSVLDEEPADPDAWAPDGVWAPHLQPNIWASSLEAVL